MIKSLFIKKIIKNLKDRNCLIALDTSNSEILKECLNDIDIIKANLYELYEIVKNGKKLITERDVYGDIYKKIDSAEEFLNWKFINEKIKIKGRIGNY